MVFCSTDQLTRANLTQNVHKLPLKFLESRTEAACAKGLVNMLDEGS